MEFPNKIHRRHTFFKEFVDVVPFWGVSIIRKRILPGMLSNLHFCRVTPPPERVQKPATICFFVSVVLYSWYTLSAWVRGWVRATWVGGWVGE